MSRTPMSALKSVQTTQLVNALFDINDRNDMAYFLRDLLTEKELAETGARLEAARLLKSGATYTEIITKTKLSSRTVARISEWMKNGCGGYQIVLNNLQHNHTLPDGAE